MAPFVDHKRAGLALVALFSEAPNEIFAMRTKGWLLEESGHKTVVFDHGNVSFLKRALPNASPDVVIAANIGLHLLKLLLLLLALHLRAGARR